MLDIKKVNGLDFGEIYGEDTYKDWLKKYSILANENIENWIKSKLRKFIKEGKDAKNFKITSYFRYLQQYCDYNKVDSPDDLLGEDVDARNERLMAYLNFLYKGDLQEIKNLGFTKRPADVPIRNMIQSRIKSFFSNRGCPITDGLKARKSGANKNELTLDKKIIKQIQNKLGSINYRLICKFETQEGLRIGDVLKEITATVESDGKEVAKYNIELHQNNYFIRNFETQKEKVIINYLFFTQELAEILQSAYPEYNDLTKLDLSKLFLTKKDTRTNENDYLYRLKDIVKELGITGNMKTHSFRKYFTSIISQGKDIEERFNKHLEGREPDYRDATYARHLKDINWAYKHWLIIEKKVCIDCFIVDMTDEKIKNVEAKYNELIKEALEKDKQIAEMAKKLKSQNTEMHNIKAAFSIKSESTDKEMGILKIKMSKLDELITPEIFTALKREIIIKGKKIEEEIKN